MAAAAAAAFQTVLAASAMKQAKRNKRMRSTKIALHLAALGLGTALIAGPAVAQDYYVGDQQAKTGQPGAAAPGASNYPTGRSANDGGFVTQPQNQAAPERQFAWEGNNAAYGGQYRTGQYYNYSPNWGFGAPAQPIAPNDVTDCQARFRSFDPASGTYLGFDGARHSCP
jgi:hypothetical protein